jgi:hypothetical protein
MKAAREASHAKMRALLTAEQREQLDAMKAKHEAKHGAKGKGKHAKGKGKGKNKRADGERGASKKADDGKTAKLGLRDRGRGGKTRGFAKRAGLTAG